MWRARWPAPRWRSGGRRECRATGFGWCLCNRALAGVPAVALGVIMNLLIMAFHGGAMPIYADTLADIGHSFAPGTLLMGSKDVVVQSAALWSLSDWLV